jgi:hypothetical protein
VGDERRDELAAAAEARALPYFEISSATGEGVVRLVRAMADRLDEIEAVEDAEAAGDEEERW